MKFHRGINPKSGMGIGRGKYSKKEFPGYRYRASVEIGFKVDKEFHYTRIDVYTDQEDRQKVEEELRNRAKSNVVSVRVDSWSSALEDKLSEAFIEETLKGL